MNAEQLCSAERKGTSRRPSLVYLAVVLGICTLALLSSVAIHSPGLSLYREAVEKNSLIQGLEPELVLAMISVESGGKPTVVSHKGAMGLMQIMPTTAEETAKKIGMDIPVREDLFDPDINIHLGTAYFARLKEKYSNDLTLALGAYNAGPRRVDIWRKENPDLSSEELRKKVFYKETRNYVSAVLRKRRLLKLSHFFRQNKDDKK